VGHRSRVGFWLGIAGGVAGVLLLGYLVLLATHWPYQQKAVIEGLERIFHSRVEVKRFRSFYFPHPGFEAEGVTVRYKGRMSGPPLAQAEKVVGWSDFRDIFFQTGHCRLLTVEGAKVVLGGGGGSGTQSSFSGSSETKKNVSKTIVDLLTVHNAQVFVGSDPLLSHIPFGIDWLVLRGVTHDRPINFSVTMMNAIPAGWVEASGQVGPIRPESAGGTPASGAFRLLNADLSRIPGFAGKVTAGGVFKGKLSHLEVQGDATTPDFQVPNGQPEPLAVRFRALVNAPKKDVLLGPVQVRVRQTTLFAQGSIAGEPKTATFNFAVDEGRVEDLMSLFMTSRPPVAGPVVLRAHAVLPSGPQSFLERLRLGGHFTMSDTRFVVPSVRQSLTSFDKRAEGKPGSHAVADWRSHGDPPAGDAAEMDSEVMLIDGVAHASELHFRMTGLSARMHGTYALEGGRANLTGELRTQRSLSNDTSGWKKVVLKPLAPLFRHKHAGAVVPIAITGNKQHYNIGTQLMK
jgi:hypothetical protein